MNRQHLGRPETRGPLRHRRLHVERLEDRQMLSGTPGDFDASGLVDAADYTVWRDDLGSEIALVNDNGLGVPIGQTHYELWKANFGSSATVTVFWDDLEDAANGQSDPTAQIGMWGDGDGSENGIVRDVHSLGIPAPPGGGRRVL